MKKRTSTKAIKAAKAASSRATSPQPAVMQTVLPPVTPDNRGLVSIDQVEAKLSDGLGFDRVQIVSGSTYKDTSTIIIIPTRDPMIHHRVLSAWEALIAPMNQKRAKFIVVGDEVGVAYTNTIRNILADKELSTWKYIMTLESDNLPPPDAHLRLLETIDQYNFDGVSGLYWTKGDINMPMAYGDPDEYRRTGVLKFEPRDVRNALASGHVMEVNGIAMGCSLYRMGLFREVEPPWFVTVADIVNGAPVGFTQDLYFCKHAKERGKRFAVDMRVRVGHLDLGSGIVY